MKVTMMMKAGVFGGARTWSREPEITHRRQSVRPEDPHLVNWISSRTVTSQERMESDQLKQQTRDQGSIAAEK